MSHFFSSSCRLSVFFIALAIGVALFSLWVTRQLLGDLEEEERGKMEIWARATESVTTGESTDVSLALEILQRNTTIPLILYDQNTGQMTARNIRLTDQDTARFLAKKMRQFGEAHDPIPLQEMNQLLYYDDSRTLRIMEFYPYLQVVVLSLLIALAFFALNRSQRAERNRVWVGLSKETAHQLGTPISSLIAWVEYMKLKDIDGWMLEEVEKDIDRLRMIADRFSKIGSVPELAPADLRTVIQTAASYMRKRISDEVSFVMDFPERPVMVDLNNALFGWVIENLVKNAVDAMQGRGIITFCLSENGSWVFFDVCDKGKGIAKSKFRTVFSPGYTTKERGWGLGLSLVKRIVEESHKGKIFVKNSDSRSGTVFRIELRKSVS